MSFGDLLLKIRLRSNHGHTAIAKFMPVSLCFKFLSSFVSVACIVMYCNVLYCNVLVISALPIRHV